MSRSLATDDCTAESRKFIGPGVAVRVASEWRRSAPVRPREEEEDDRYDF